MVHEFLYKIVAYIMQQHKNFGRVSLSPSWIMFVCLGVFYCWHNSVSPKSCMPYFSLVIKPLSLLCLNLLSSSDLKLALLLGLRVLCCVSESVIMDLDTLYSVLLCVVSFVHLFFSKSSGFYSLVFQVSFFTKFRSHLVEFGYCGSCILHFDSYML